MSAAPKTADFRPWVLVIAAIVIVLDRWTKLLVEAHIPRGHYITLIPHVFQLSHVSNTGAAFSLFAQSLSPTVVREALIGFSIVAILVVLAMVFRAGRTRSITAVALGLILGGAIGNLYDRIHLSYVIDFLAVQLGSYHWPDFNVADSAIVVGALMLLVEIFRPQPADEEVPPAL